MTLGWLDVPRDVLASAGQIVRFIARMFSDVARLRVFRYTGEILRQTSLLITSSALVVAGLMYLIGLSCGVEAAYFNKSTGSPSYAGVFAAWCDLREAAPLAFGYMLAAKVGTGLVAEIGARRVSEEIDALEVMGIDSLTYLAATRLVACWLSVPFMYLCGLGACYLASYLAVVVQIGQTSPGGYFLIFWTFQDAWDVLFSLLKGMVMATFIVSVGCYYGYTASGGAVGVGTATAKSMVLNAVGVHFITVAGTQLFWGTNPRAPIGG